MVAELVPEEPAEFNLRALVREQLATSSEPNPHAIADRVLKLVPEEYLRDALGQCLSFLVRQMIYGERSMNRRPAMLAEVTQASGKGTQPPAPSRWVGVSGRYQRLLRQRECIDAEKSAWRALGEMTREEVLKAAEIRRGNAHKNASIAKRYEALAHHMEVQQVATVQELPPDVLEAVFS